MQEQNLQLNKTGWVKILDWGYNAEVYGRGNDRVMIDRKTGEVIIRYKSRKATVNSTS